MIREDEAERLKQRQQDEFDAWRKNFVDRIAEEYSDEEVYEILDQGVYQRSINIGIEELQLGKRQ